MSQYQVVTGNPVEGLKFIGPFTQPHYAAEWADEWIPDSDWWVVTVQTEEEYQNGNHEN